MYETVGSMETSKYKTKISFILIQSKKPSIVHSRGTCFKGLRYNCLWIMFKSQIFKDVSCQQMLKDSYHSKCDAGADERSCKAKELKKLRDKVNTNSIAPDSKARIQQLRN